MSTCVEGILLRISRYLGKKELLEYEIQMWDFFIITNTEASEVEIRIVFRR